MSEADKARRDKEARPPEREPQSGWGGMMLLLFMLLVAMGVSQALLGVGPLDEIRYDEFLTYVSQGRVESLRVANDELRGRYVAERRPEPRPVPEGSEAEPAERPLHFRTPRVEDPRLVERLRDFGVPFRGQNPTAWESAWPTFLSLGLTFLLIFWLWRGLGRRMAGGPAGGVLAFGKSRGKLIPERSVQVTFDDVAGADEAKEELNEIIEFLQRPDKFKRIGAKIPKGVLLVGPPGTGKTLIARAVAGEAGVPFISISGSEFVEMFVGVGAARVRDLFEQANKSAPCIVFIDELDALGRSRAGAGPISGNEERETTLNQLLVNMDGFEPRDAVIIMAATNRPEVLDPALLRPGRFDRQVLIDRPDRKGREAILWVHVRGVRVAADVDLRELAQRTPGFAGADLSNLVNEAALLAARRGADAVAMGDFSKAIDRVVAGLERKSRLISPEERERIAYHEVGHAICSTLSGFGQRVHKISIVPRGMSALGFTMQLPEQERYLMTEGEIRGHLVGLLGGRAAEEVVFGEASTGAQDDLQKASDIARAMVTEYGMSEALGPVHLAKERIAPFLGETGGLSAHGAELRDRVDREVKLILERALREAKQVLEDRRSALDAITARLLELEQLEGAELSRLLGDLKGAEAHPLL